MKLVLYDMLSPEMFEYFLLKSEDIAGCTGDMSLTQALSSGRVPIYQQLIHKTFLYKALNDEWKWATQDLGGDKDEYNNLPVIPRNNLDHHKYKFRRVERFHEAYARFIDNLKENSLQKWFWNELRERLSASKNENNPKIEKRAEETTEDSNQPAAITEERPDVISEKRSIHLRR